MGWGRPLWILMHLAIKCGPPGKTITRVTIPGTIPLIIGRIITMLIEWESPLLKISASTPTKRQTISIGRPGNKTLRPLQPISSVGGLSSSRPIPGTLSKILTISGKITTSNSSSISSNSLTNTTNGTKITTSRIIITISSGGLRLHSTLEVAILGPHGARIITISIIRLATTSGDRISLHLLMEWTRGEITIPLLSHFGTLMPQGPWPTSTPLPLIFQIPPHSSAPSQARPRISWTHRAKLITATRRLDLGHK